LDPLTGATQTATPHNIKNWEDYRFMMVRSNDDGESIIAVPKGASKTE